MIEKKLYLEGLDCPNCAAKIENEVKKLAKIENARVNFLTKTLLYESKENKAEELKKIEKIVKKIEPNISIREIIEEKENSEEDEENDNKKRIIYLSIGGIIFATAFFIELPWLRFLLFLIAYFISGWRVLIGFLKNFVKGNLFDEKFLMSVATIGAFTIGQFAEAVAVMLFYETGEFFQDLAVDNSKKSIKSLLDLRPDYANVMRNGKILNVPAKEIKIGEIVLIKPGERVPFDGVIVKGQTSVDTSTLTGESIPRFLEEGDEILSGFVNLEGTISIRVKRKLSESTISRILKLVEESAAKKSKTEKFITQFAKYYTPIVVFSAIILAIIPPLFDNFSFSTWIYRALIFLVISCPCALVLSLPLTYFAGIGKSSKEGILVKGGNYMEALKKIQTVIFDKTGTLTEGIFEVSKVEPQNGFKKEDVLKIAASAEIYSDHPIALSIKKAYGKETNEKLIDEHREILGHGVYAKVKGKEIIVGNEKLMKKYGIEIPKIDFPGTIVYVVLDGYLVGYIGISDRIKSEAVEAIEKLRKLGVKKIVMLTGDNSKIAERVAKGLELDEYWAELLPDEKVKKFENIKEGLTAFVGDGINDAPILSRADVGISMGGLGSDAAIESSDVVIMDDNLLKIPRAIIISKKTSKIAWQNVALVLAVKILFLILGALGFISMWGAIFADVGVALLAVFNSIRILIKDF